MNAGDNVENWSAVRRFNFSWACEGGAWLDFGGYVNWYSWSVIEKHLGRNWIDQMLEKQGWTTGCWVDVPPELFPKMYPDPLAR
jgi:hypothetical protein